MKRRLVLATAFALTMAVGCAKSADPTAGQTSMATLEAATVQTETEPQTVSVAADQLEDQTVNAQIEANQTKIVTQAARNSITMDEAKLIAMKDAGVSSETVSYSSAKQDWDDGREIYEVDFFSTGMEYEYEILAADGTILKKKQVTERSQVFGMQAGKENPAAALTLEQARQKVAERIPGVDPGSIYIKEDYDDGRLEYEGEVFYNQVKYEFELDGTTGVFRDWEEETGR